MAIHILLARQRSGTGALGTLLNQHPDIHYLGEVFHPGQIDKEDNYFNFLLKLIKQDPEKGLPGAAEANFKAYIAHLEQFSPKQHKIIDIKYSSTHHLNGYWYSPLAIPNLLLTIQREQCKILHLKRNNFLKTFISGQLAEQNKIWHASPKDDLKVTQITIKPVQLMNYLRTTANQVNNFDSYLVNYPSTLELEYEALFSNNGHLTPQVAESLVRFLNLEQGSFESTRPSFVKQTSDDLEKVIENYKEISKLLQDTEYAWMITDATNPQSTPTVMTEKINAQSVVKIVGEWIDSGEATSIRPHSFMSTDLIDAISEDGYMENKVGMLKYLATQIPAHAKVLDFGCGNLPQKKHYDELNFDWLGLDYSNSIDPEYIKAKDQKKGDIIYYNGLIMPFNDGQFDMLWTSQALEHIQDIDITFGEISRIVKTGGYFAGSVSFLEPYHARSTFSYTPWGFNLLCNKYGFKLIKVAPGIDGLTLLLKRLSVLFSEGEQDWAKLFDQRGVLTSELSTKMINSGFSKKDINALLLQICGHFRFIATKQT